MGVVPGTLRKQRITAVEALQHPFFQVKLPQHIDMVELQARMQKEESKETGEGTNGSRKISYEIDEGDKETSNVSFCSKKAMSLLEKARYKPNVKPSTMISKNS